MSSRAAKITTQQLGTQRVDFKKDDFDILVHQKGLELTHEITVKCSCIREINGNAKLTCIDCGGSGYIFIDPCTLRGVIQAIGFNPKKMQYSEVNLGTALLTMRYTERLGWMDRFTIKDGETIFMENTFPLVRTINGSPQMSSLLTYDPIKAVKVFMYVDDSTSQQELIEGTDFSLSGRKLILSDEIMGAAIAAGEQKKYISIRYRHRPQYLVMDVQRDIRNTRQIVAGGEEILNHMPVFCTLKKAHYILNDPGFGSGAETL